MCINHHTQRGRYTVPLGAAAAAAATAVVVVVVNGDRWWLDGGRRGSYIHIIYTASAHGTTNSTNNYWWVALCGLIIMWKNIGISTAVLLYTYLFYLIVHLNRQRALYFLRAQGTFTFLRETLACLPVLAWFGFDWSCMVLQKNHHDDWLVCGWLGVGCWIWGGGRVLLCFDDGSSSKVSFLFVTVTMTMVLWLGRSLHHGMYVVRTYTYLIMCGVAVFVRWTSGARVL